MKQFLILLVMLTLFSCDKKRKNKKPEDHIKNEKRKVDLTVFPRELGGIKKMLLIQGGVFLMGDNDSEFKDEKPVSEILMDAFYMDETPVTYRDFEKYVAAGGTKSAYWKYETYHIDQQPVTGLNWYHAADYCNWRSKKEGLKPAYIFTDELDDWGYPGCKLDENSSGYRLPTEAQFEFAARGGLSQKLYPWGNEFETSFVNYDTEKGEMKGEWWRLAKVKTQKKNNFGLYGMSGNIWQWCQDWYEKEHYKNRKENINPSGPEKSSIKSMRGGSWGSINPKFLRTAKRSFSAPGNYNYEIGFRCVRPVDSSILKKLSFIPNENISHQFYEYTTSHYDTPLKSGVYSEEFINRLAKFLGDYYPNCIYFQQKVDQQEILTPKEMANLIVEITRDYKVNPLFLTGIMVSESGFASCSFPRWFNSPMAYHWQNVRMKNGLPMYIPTKGRNRKYKTLKAGFRRFCKGIRREVYYKAARNTLDEFHLVYVGYRADEWMYTLSRVYKDVLGVRFEPKIPLKDAGSLIYTDWNGLK